MEIFYAAAVYFPKAYCESGCNLVSLVLLAVRAQRQNSSSVISLMNIRLEMSPVAVSSSSYLRFFSEQSTSK